MSKSVATGPARPDPRARATGRTLAGFAVTLRDIILSVAAGTPTIDLAQDETRYLEIHHTSDDTLDKIDLAQLRQNVAAWTAMLAILANYKTPLEAGKETTSKMLAGFP